MPQFVIRNLRPEDVPSLLTLPRGEGREMGLEPELLSWLRVDPNAVFVAESLDDGRIAGCCSGMALSERHGYVGMYVVGEKYRGVGLGRMLWREVMARLGPTRNIGLSSVEHMVPCYRDNAGFIVAAPWTVDLYRSSLPTVEIPPTADAPQTLAVTDTGVARKVAEYDASIHSYDRRVIVQATLTEPGTSTLAAVRGPRVCGYGCIKRSLQGHWLLAPLYADDADAAHAILWGLLASLSDEQKSEGIVAKLVSSNGDAERLFDLFGMERTKYRLRRLFTREVFPIPEAKIFALQSSVFCTE